MADEPYKRWVFDVPIYGTQVSLHMGCPIRSAKYISGLIDGDVDPIFPDAGGYTWDIGPPDGGTHHVGIWFPNCLPRDPVERYKTIAHEALHASLNILDSAGIRSTARNSEPLAYMIGWFVEQITRRLPRGSLPPVKRKVKKKDKDTAKPAPAGKGQARCGGVRRGSGKSIKSKNRVWLYEKEKIRARTLA